MGTERSGGRAVWRVVAERVRCAARTAPGQWPGERGSATAEYAVVILAAVAFAGLLVAVMKSGEVKDLLVGIVRGALSL